MCVDVDKENETPTKGAPGGSLSAAPGDPQPGTADVGQTTAGPEEAV